MKKFSESIWSCVHAISLLAIIASSAYGLSCLFGEYSIPIGLALLFLFPYSIAKQKKQKQQIKQKRITELLYRPEFDSVSDWVKYEIIKAIKND